MHVENKYTVKTLFKSGLNNRIIKYLNTYNNQKLNYIENALEKYFSYPVS